MKYIALLILLVGCAAQQPPGCDMSYSCGNDSRCIQHLGYGQSGHFQNEQDCLVWETAFLNSGYNHSVSATACSCN